MSNYNKNLGAHGEDLALEFLKKKGYKLVKRNLRMKAGEIDLLMQTKNTFVIVEVKTKTSHEYGAPQDEIDFFKKRKLIQLAKSLWQIYPAHSIRIDVIAVDEQSKTIDHIVNAVEEH